MGSHRLLASLALAVLALVIGATAAGSPAAATATSAAGASIAVGKSRFGPILFDGRGYALYVFTSDSRGRATCYSACAKRWPPYLVKARPVTRNGAKASLVGVARRKNGQLEATYAGRPLYYYVGDGKGVVLCQNVAEFGGTWLVLRGSGGVVR
jgi:predicted lipoprotein with Yx(FWY)xxD motif